MLLCLHEEHAVPSRTATASAPTSRWRVLHSNVGLMHGIDGDLQRLVRPRADLHLGATGPVDANKRRPWIDWIHTAKDQGALIRNFVKFDDEPRSPQAMVESMLRANKMMRPPDRAGLHVPRCRPAGTAATGEVAIPDVARYRAAPRRRPPPRWSRRRRHAGAKAQGR